MVEQNQPPSPSQQEKKPSVACFFCSGCKISCGPPPSESQGQSQTCSQCQNRSLNYNYPTESGRGIRNGMCKQSAAQATASDASKPNEGRSERVPLDSAVGKATTNEAGPLVRPRTPADTHKEKRRVAKALTGKEKAPAKPGR
ncbi:hypothetical protein HGRIS_011189 [Hohenbuehelia grisea]|uniref:Uncharacterized protein n=1 Tax=Hohenbuehelia grisea TaxID=104357 RepID=A0ABR3JUB8_9AGAR